MTPERIAEIKRITGGTSNKVAIVVLGGGREAMAPEYGMANLNHLSLQRLHYGVWLSRQTGAPMLFSGGIGHADSVGVTEAEIAARIADKDYGRPLTWTETESRDTRENAVRSVAMLKSAGITDLVLVSHGFHMPRAIRAFETRSAAHGCAHARVACADGSGAAERASSDSLAADRGGLPEDALGLHELAGLLSWSLSGAQKTKPLRTPKGGRGG